MASRLDLNLDKGATFYLDLFWKYPDPNDPKNFLPIDLGPFEARMMVREEYDDPDPFISLTSLDSSGSRIDVDVPNNTIRIIILPSTSEVLFEERGVYDLEMYRRDDLEYVVRLVQGKIRIKPEATRA